MTVVSLPPRKFARPPCYYYGLQEVTSYGTRLRAWRFEGSSLGRGNIILSSPKRPDRLWGPPILFSGYPCSLSGVKRSRRKFNHWPPCSAEVKNEQSHTSVLLICLQAVDREAYRLHGWVFSSSTAVRHTWSLTTRGVEEVRVFCFPCC